jgi:predicted nucleic acid-binding protein
MPTSLPPSRTAIDDDTAPWIPPTENKPLSSRHQVDRESDKVEVIEAAEEVRNALDWYAYGADFADALHLAACGTAVMHTFDRSFCTAARAAGIAPDVRIWEV